MRFITVLISGIMMLLTSCGFGHSCAKDWHGSYTRYSGDYPINESWEISVNSDGTCNAVNNASGFKSYSHNYNGTWTALSDDVIRIDLTSDVYGAHVTSSYSDIEHAASKAQTRWKRDKVYQDAYKPRATSRSYNETFYLRSDGAVSNFPDGLDSPLMICH